MGSQVADGFNIDKCTVMNVGNLEGKILTTGTT